MGTYLSTPVLDKHTEKGSDLADANTPVRWAVVDMQGWRKSMEDAHVARTDVPLPGCCKPKGGDDGGGGGGEGSGEAAAEEGGGNDNDAGAANPAHAKVFAVFDGHGGAEVARFCQIHLVPVLTSQSEWADTGSSGEEEDGENLNMNLASRVGRALIHSFHALDRLIDDPAKRGEIDKWRSERPPPYAAQDDGEEKKEEEGMEAEETSGEAPPMGAEDVDEDELQARRHTVMDPSEIAADAAKVEQLLDVGEESEPSETIEKGTTIEEDEKDVPSGTDTSNLPNMLDDEDHEVFEDSVSDHADLENTDSEGVVRDDSDDEKEEKGSANEDDDGEVDAEVEGAPKKEAGTMVLSANDAVALFQKLLHMNGSDEDEDDEDEECEADANGEKMNGTAGGEEAEVVIPTKEQLLNPPTGIVAPSASVPTRVQNGRKICNLPDHAVHAGCTAVVAVIVGRTLVVANAGDSRAVICRAGGLTEPLSFDHKPLQNREMNRITHAGGFVNQFGRVNGNLNLSRSIGDLKYKQVPGISPAEQMITAEPDILSTNLREGDEFIVLGCDGIWDCLANEECVKYVRDRIDSKHPHEIGAEMLDDIVSADPRASQGIGGDNMTLLIVDLQPESRSYHGSC
ncbi:hypothetical protein ACHAXT_010322 [Thalassiosira profunda]